jgi:ATP-binding cassette subfamily F protein 3
VEAPVAQPKNGLKEKGKEEKKLRNRFEKIESELNKLQEEQASFELLLASPETYAQAEVFKKTETEYQKVLQLIAPVKAEYETLFEQLMEFE